MVSQVACLIWKELRKHYYDGNMEVFESAARGAIHLYVRLHVLGGGSRLAAAIQLGRIRSAYSRSACSRWICRVIERMKSLILPPFEKDFDVGDCVKVRGRRGIAIVQQVNENTLAVSWPGGRHEILPLVCFKRCPPGGSNYDRKPK